MFGNKCTQLCVRLSKHNVTLPEVLGVVQWIHSSHHVAVWARHQLFFENKKMSALIHVDLLNNHMTLSMLAIIENDHCLRLRMKAKFKLYTVFGGLRNKTKMKEYAVIYFRLCLTL